MVENHRTKDDAPDPEDASDLENASDLAEARKRQREGSESFEAAVKVMRRRGEL